MDVVICEVEFKCLYRLEYFFKDRFKFDENSYIIPSQQILQISRTLFPKIREGCSYVCPSDIPCNHHKFLNYIQKIIDSLIFSVEEEKIWYKSF